MTDIDRVVSRKGSCPVTLFNPSAAGDALTHHSPHRPKASGLHLRQNCVFSCAADFDASLHFVTAKQPSCHETPADGLRGFAFLCGYPTADASSRSLSPERCAIHGPNASCRSIHHNAHCSSCGHRIKRSSVLHGVCAIRCPVHKLNSLSARRKLSQAMASAFLAVSKA